MSKPYIPKEIPPRGKWIVVTTIHEDKWKGQFSIWAGDERLMHFPGHYEILGHMRSKLEFMCALHNDEVERLEKQMGIFRRDK